MPVTCKTAGKNEGAGIRFTVPGVGPGACVYGQSRSLTGEEGTHITRITYRYKGSNRPKESNSGGT